MRDLDEQIRILIDDVEPVTVAEVFVGQYQLRKSVRLYVPLSAAAAILVVVAVVAAVIGSPSDHGPSTPQLRWHLAGYTGPASLSVQGSAGSGTYALQCPTTSTCYATEPVVVSQTVVPNGVVETSSDGGHTWRIILDKPGVDLTRLDLSERTHLFCHRRGLRIRFTSGHDVFDDRWGTRPGFSMKSPVAARAAHSSRAIVEQMRRHDHVGRRERWRNGQRSRNRRWRGNVADGVFPRGSSRPACNAVTSACVATGIQQHPQASNVREWCIRWPRNRRWRGGL